METTYTYTARSVDNPERVVTFTFYDNHLIVDVGAPIEHVDRALQVQQPGEDEAEYGISSWLKPMAVSALERSTHPFDVSDTYAELEGSQLSVTAWVRAGGLRLVPISFNMAHVDNVDAAQAFVDQLDERKADGRRPGRFPGLLDYWATWLVGIFSTVVLLASWLRRQYKEAAA